MHTCVLLQVRIIHSGDQLDYSTCWASSVRTKRTIIVSYITVVFYIIQGEAQQFETKIF